MASSHEVPAKAWMERAHPGSGSDRLQLILDHAPVLVYVVDEDHRFLDVNRAWRQLGGLREADVVGRSLFDVFDEATARQFVANNRQVLAGGQPLTIEETHGGRAFLSVKVPVRDASGRAYAVCGMSVDITARRDAEDRLRESEQRFRIMADGLPLILWVHGPDGEQQFVNTTFCEFFGVSPEEMHDDRWQALVHPEDAENYVSEFIAAVRGRRAFHREVRVRRADGEWRWLECWARPRYSASGQFLGMVGASADVTDRKLADQRLQLSDANLRDAMQRNNEFVATLAHEMRTPLAVMRNALAVYDLREAGESDLKAARELVVRQVGHLARLADDLFDVSRSRLGKLRLDLEPVDMRAVVNDALLGTQVAIASARHMLVYEPPERPASVVGDRLRLSQIVGNLLTNAIRYTPPGGEIRLSLTCDEDDVVLHVADSGIGLGEGDFEAIFQPFNQLGDGANRVGLGVGLALVKDLVELHGGSVAVYSPGPGHGSTFVVRLPRTD